MTIKTDLLLIRSEIKSQRCSRWNRGPFRGTPSIRQRSIIRKLFHHVLIPIHYHSREMPVTSNYAGECSSRGSRPRKSNICLGFNANCGSGDSRPNCSAAEEPWWIRPGVTVSTTDVSVPFNHEKGPVSSASLRSVSPGAPSTVEPEQ